MKDMGSRFYFCYVRLYCSRIQTATTFAQPTNSVRLGGHRCNLVVAELGQQLQLSTNCYLDGNKVGTVNSATTVPDDVALEMNMFINSKGTVANHLAIDWFQTILILR